MIDREMITVSEKVQCLLRPDGSVDWQGGELESATADEMSRRLPRGWKWEARTNVRTGYIGRMGGFVETESHYEEILEK